MFVTTVTLPALKGEQARETMEWLNRAAHAARRQGAPGFLQAYLMREDGGGVIAMAFWRTKSDFHSYVASTHGRDALQALPFQALKGIKVTSYHTTWQARYSDDPASVAGSGSTEGGCP